LGQAPSRLVRYGAPVARLLAPLLERGEGTIRLVSYNIR
jgi:hypothetical protein